MPDGIFWYSLATTLALTLVGIIWKYVAKTEKLFERIIDKQNEHETRITVLEEVKKA